ncbi:hypothetical protein [Glaciibacter psychrotolerans]|uniref:DNA-binding transcriptional MerR regulator n=1 Tax=Glaciibacter psychrotolerans TaxID=670054 RepID=A0A7Z0EFY5_9MICO|nr:hypothetical protein [Leifsonia psychrotolerans]NYJ20820.1 DNA-binding transcriptional MerR regulator [Leifsonia psychrotolerans]
MTTEQLLTTTQVAAARGVSRQAILAAVKRGTLTPAFTLGNGYYLFEPEVSR